MFRVYARHGRCLLSVRQCSTFEANSKEFWKSEERVAVQQGWDTEQERNENGTALFVSLLKSYPLFCSDPNSVLRAKWLFKHRRTVRAVERDPKVSVCDWIINKLKTENQCSVLCSCNQGWNALHCCAAQPKLSAMLEWFLCEGSIHPNKVTHRSETPLHIAADYRNAKGVELLIRDGRVDLNHKDMNEHTALDKAYSVDCVSCLIQSGALSNEESTLAKCVRHPSLNHTLLGSMLQSKLDDSFNGAFLSAIQAGNVGAVTRLLDEKKDVENAECFSMDQKSPLILSLIWCQTEVTRVLLSQSKTIRKSVNHSDSFGMTALMYAVWMHDTSIVKLLLDYGSDPTLKNHKGESAMQIAKNHERWECVKLLK